MKKGRGRRMKSWGISNLTGLGEEGELAEKKNYRKVGRKREISWKPGKEGTSKG